MKRALGLVFILIACIIGFLSIRGQMPFMPIFGSSMEPELHSGSLLMIEPTNASEIKVGDIIVYNVPRLIREYYSYPPVIAHRVIKVNRERGLSFRTAGDNAGEDPFTVMPGDLRGKVGDQISYLGLPLLFLQSKQGLIFVILFLLLLALYLYSGELGAGKNKLHRGVFSPVIKETSRSNRVLTQKMENTEQQMDKTQQALEKFAAAIELYAQHLASHTSAIQGLSEASHELKRSAAEQNKVLGDLVQRYIQETPKAEPRVGHVVVPKKEPPAGERPIVKAHKLPGAEQVVFEVQAEPTQEEAKPMPEESGAVYPPGCVINRRALLKKIRDLHQGKS